MQVDHSLVNAHLEAVPGLGTFTARRFACRDAEYLGGHAHRAVNFELLFLGSLNQVRADLLQALHVRARQRDANAMHRDLLFGLFALFLVRLGFC